MTWVQSSPSETQLYLVERDQRRPGRILATIVDRQSRQACRLPRLQVLPDYTSHMYLCLYPKGHKRTPMMTKLPKTYLADSELKRQLGPPLCTKASPERSRKGGRNQFVHQPGEWTGNHCQRRRTTL